MLATNPTVRRTRREVRLSERITATLSDPADVDDEIRKLFAALTAG